MLLRRTLIATLGAAALLGAAPAAAEPWGLVQALDEFGSLAALQRPASPPRRLGMLSSWDRNGANFDQGNFQRETPDGGRVLADLRGPGVVTRLWTAEPMGTLHFFWDDSPTPQLVVPWQDLLAGRVPPFNAPFISTKAGGGTIRFPLPFAKSLRVELHDRTWCHWQLHYQYFTPETEVASWWPSQGPPAGGPEAFTRAAVVWERPYAPRGLGTQLYAAQLALSPAHRGERCMPPQDVMITELAMVQVSGTVLPEDLTISIGQGAEHVELPWRTLAGVWDSTRDAPGLLQGRQGTRTWFRVPFLLRQGEPIDLKWSGTEGEFLGDFTVTGRPAEAAELATAPRLFAFAQRHQVGRGLGLDSGPIAGQGRLLAVGTRVRATANAYYMEGDETIFLEGETEPSFRGTGLEDLFDSAWYFAGGEFSTPVSAAPMVSKDWLNTAARTAWWPLGVPFSRSLRFELEGGAGNMAPPTEHELVLIGQRFGPAVAVPPPERREPTLTPAEVGLRTTGEADEAGLPTYMERTAPVSATLRPMEYWLDPDHRPEGTLDLAVRAPVQYLAVRLDLPHGWKGTLEGWGETKEVFDIGWPPIERWDAPLEEVRLRWTATPPPIVRPGDTVIQLRVEARMADGSLHTVRHPVRVHATPAGEPEIRWSAADLTTSGTLEATLRLPEDFEARPGDIVVLDARAEDPSAWYQGEAQLHWRPRGPVGNRAGADTEIVPLLPPDGRAPGRLLFDGTPHRIAFRAGRLPSWIGAPRELLVSLADYPTARWTLDGAALYRHLPFPNPEGQAERLAYRETLPDRFDPPQFRALLRGQDLLRAMERVVATPQDQALLETQPSEYLENAEAGPLLWRLADPPRRPGGRLPSEGVLFPARHIGERVLVRHPAIAGARVLGIQFGYGPWCGTVGVRDCEGRLLAVQDLYMNRPCTFPQYTRIPLTVPSRDPWFYLEALGPSRGGWEVRLPVHKVMVVE